MKKVILIRGNAQLPQRFWDREVVDADDKEKIDALLKQGYFISGRQNSS
jgi:hypothetical protein